MALKIEGIELHWLGHAGFKIKSGKVIYIDPYHIGDSEPADIILITHSHYDHCSIEDIRKIVKDNTAIICPADCQSAITKIDKKVNMQLIEAGEKLKLGNIEFHAVPAYNINKQFHEKSEGWVGYVIKLGKVIIYHAGDTDLTEDMKKLTGYSKEGNKFIALLPIGGKFTMNYEEASQAAEIIKADIAIPMHYGTIISSGDDAEKFQDLCKDNGIEAKIMEIG